MRDSERQRLLNDVRILYYEALAAQRRVEVQDRLANLAADALGTTRQLFNTGAADLPDVLESEIEVREVKRHAGHFAQRLVCEASARDENNGRELKLSGAVGRAELERLVATLVDGQGEAGPEVRRYIVGRSPRVEDPRTGEATPRVKDVLRGEIDLFIAAWISRPPAETA